MPSYLHYLIHLHGVLLNYIFKYSLPFLTLRLPAGKTDVSLPHSLQTRAGAHPVRYPMDTGSSFSGVKRLGRQTDDSPPTSRKKDGAIPFSQVVEAHRVLRSRGSHISSHMVARLSALSNGRPLYRQECSWYSFLLSAGTTLPFTVCL
jgi:hypothetical protein